jgi:flagellar export protein FliJ
MAADLNPLIRVQKHALEQKQKFLAELYRQAEEYEKQKEHMLETLEKERNNLEGMGPEMLSYFGPYSESVKERCKEIDAALLTLNTRIDFAREEIRNAFAELKKIEMTQEERDNQEQKAIDKKQSDELDEIGLEVFRRKQSEN